MTATVVEEWSTLVNPECLIPPYIESFTGITNEMVAAAPRFADIAQLVLEKLGRGLRQACAALRGAQRALRLFVPARRIPPRGMPFSATVLCTVKLSRRLFPEHVRHSLDAVMERHGLACSARHRALGDARVISDFWLKLQPRAPEARLAAAAHSALGAAKLPAHLPAGLAGRAAGRSRESIASMAEPARCSSIVGKSVSLRTAHSGSFRRGRAEEPRNRSCGRRCGASTGWRPPASSARCCASRMHQDAAPLYNRHLKAAPRASR